MKRITNYLNEFVRWILGKRDITDGTIWIQKKILNNRHYKKKQNKLHGNQPITNHLSIIASLAKKNDNSVIFFKQMTPKSKKISRTYI
jgi:hypothetical protein|tara:strand:+ start:325 stop:588 length:264 start_codon:yes stop_codon:yes gene_type:complete